MSEDEYESPAAPACSPVIPILVLGASLLVILIWQIANIRSQSTSMAEAKKQFADAIEKREVAVKQSVDLQGKLQALAMDLIELGKTDEKAKAIVAKYNIQQTIPPAAAPAPEK